MQDAERKEREKKHKQNQSNETTSKPKPSDSGEKHKETHPGKVQTSEQTVDTLEECQEQYTSTVNSLLNLDALNGLTSHEDNDDDDANALSDTYEAGYDEFKQNIKTGAAHSSVLTTPSVTPKAKSRRHSRTKTRSKKHSGTLYSFVISSSNQICTLLLCFEFLLPLL